MAAATIAPDELDTFHQKFERFAEELSSRELAFLQAILSGAAAESGDEVEGHMFDPAFVPMHAELLHHINHLVAILHAISSHHHAAMPVPQRPRG
jgi:hypothetical protein